MIRIFQVMVFMSFFVGTGIVRGDGFSLTSPDIRHGDFMATQHEYNGFGCSGENISPALRWSGAPQGTKSFAVTVYDPDAPTGSGWWHWVIFNIPADVHELPRGAGNPGSGLAPAGSVQSRTDFGVPGFGGPCPPVGHGVHHYRFTVFALDVERLDIPADAPAAMVGYNLNAHKLGEATIEALYQR